MYKLIGHLKLNTLPSHLSGTKPVYECEKCSALVTYEGQNQHSHFHNSLHQS